jgi:hypothetical protein
MIKTVNYLYDLRNSVKELAILKHKIDLPKRIAVIRRHVAKGKYRYLKMQLKALSKYSETMHRDIEMVKGMALSLYIDRDKAF